MNADSSHAVLYHAECVDGFTAAWLIRKHVGLAADLKAVYHGDPIPDVDAYTHVWVADFSYPMSPLLGLAMSGQHVILLDHHQSAYDTYSRLELNPIQVSGSLIHGTATTSKGGSFTVTIDLGRSGAGIAWDHFNTTLRPPLVDYVEDRDLWRNNLPHSREVSAFLRTQPFVISRWDELAATPIETIAEVGYGCVAQLDAIIQTAVNDSYMCTMGDRTFPITNVVYTAGSETAEKLIERWGTPMAAYFYQLSDGSWKYGFRSDPESGVTVHDFAEQFNGGGHKTASGARLAEITHQRI